MSAVRPNCSICLGPHTKEIDKLLRMGTANSQIARMLAARKVRYERHGRAHEVEAYTVNTVRNHRILCLAKDIIGEETATERAERASDPRGPGYIAAGDVKTPGAKAIEIDAEELRDPTRRLGVLREALAQKLGDLSAKDLYAMYMAEMRLQEKEAERDIRRIEADRDRDDRAAPKPEPEPDDGLDEAMAAAAGHKPDLRVVRGRREVSRRA